MSLSHWRGWVIAGVIFALGVAVGGAGTTIWGVHRLRRALQASNETTSFADRAAARIGAQLTKELALTDAESSQVQQILSESAANLKVIRAKTARQAALELRAASRQIAAVLPTEKRAGFYRVIAKRYHRLGLMPPTPADGDSAP